MSAKHLSKREKLDLLRMWHRRILSDYKLPEELDKMPNKQLNFFFDSCEEEVTKRYKIRKDASEN